MTCYVLQRQLYNAKQFPLTRHIGIAGTATMTVNETFLDIVADYITAGLQHKVYPCAHQHHQTECSL